MKNLFKAALSVAVASVFAIGCTEVFDPTTNAPQEPSAEKVSVTAIAGTPDTRIVVGDKTDGVYAVTWSSDDALFYAEVLGSEKDLHCTPGDDDNHESVATNVTDGKQATFELSKTKGASSTFHTYYPYSAVSDFYYDETVGNVAYLNIPQVQTPAAGEKIDPAAALMYAEGVSTDDESPVVLKFEHLAAYVHLTFTGLDSNDNAPTGNIESVQFFAKQGHYLSGQYFHYLDGTANNPASEEQTCYSDVVVNLENHQIAANSSEFDVWFVCMPSLSEDGITDFAVRVTTTDGQVYRRAFNGKYTFEPKAGKVEWLKIPMDGADLMEAGAGDFVKVTNINDITDGNYIIAAYSEETTDGSKYYFAMPNGDWSKQAPGTKIDVENNTTISAGKAGGFVWTIKKDNDNYYINNGSQYLEGDTSTSLNLNDNSTTYWTIDSYIDDEHGFMLIGSASANASTKRGIGFQKYTTANSVRTYRLQFGGYATSNFKNADYTGILLFKQMGSSISASDVKAPMDGAVDATFNYSVSGDISIADVEVSDFDGNVTKAEASNGVVTYSITANTTDTPVTSTIELSTTDRKYVTRVSITQPAAGDEGEKEPIEITIDFMSSTPSGWPTNNATGKTITGGTYSYESFDFILANDTYCWVTNSGDMYGFYIAKTSALGLPAIEGYKLTTVIGTASEKGGKKANVSICSNNTGTAIDGGDAILWNEYNKPFTYTLSGTSANTSYYMYASADQYATLSNLYLKYEAE